MRKTIVITGLLTLLAGIILIIMFPKTESYTEENVLWTWEVWPQTLEPPPNPQNSTKAGRFMHEGNWFDLNVSCSGPLRITISVIERGETQSLIPIFDRVGTRFTQRVMITGMGTYDIEIKNEGSSSITINGNIVAKEKKIEPRTIYPHAWLGFPVALGGLGVLIFGFFTQAKKRLKPRKISST